MPSLSGLQNTSAAIEDTPILIDADVTFADIEGDFNGGTITISGLAVGDIISVQNEGTSTGEISFDAATGAIGFEGTQIGTLSGAVGSTATVTLSANASSASVETLLENLTFTAAADDPAASRVLTINVTDAAGNSLSADSELTRVTGSGDPFNGINASNFSIPVFVDIDNDGDMDAFVGEYGGTVNFFRNDGTAANPNFTGALGSENPLDGIDVGVYAVPAFVDVDGDGDQDVFIGERDGILNFFRNDGTDSSPDLNQIAGAQNPFNGVDVGSNSSPVFVDIDNDGDMDAFIGEYGGTLRFFRNDGSPTAPNFVAVTGANNPFNGVDIGFVPTTAFVDYDNDGDLDAFLGEGYGTMFYYRNDGNAADADFTRVTGAENPFNGLDFGFDAAPFFVDIDDDGDMDAFVGHSNGVRSVGSGTLNFFKATSPDTTSTTITVTALDDGTDDDDLRNGTDAADTFTAGLGNDTLAGGNGNDNLGGDGGADLLRGNAGDDTLLGGDGNDTLWAGEGDDGADLLSGGAGDDVIGGGSGGDTITGDGGNDVIFGGDGNGADNITGGDGDDELFSGGGNDTVDGGAGGDTLWGGAGDDSFTGGSGGDLFILASGYGNDTITDFSVGEDRLMLANTETNFSDVAAVQAAATGQGNDLLIDLGGGDSLLLIGIAVGDLAAIDFVF